MAWAPKVKRHVAYLLLHTYGGNTAYVKRRPCIITGFATDTNPILRCRHTGEVYGNAAVGVPRRTNPDANVTGVYVSY